MIEPGPGILLIAEPFLKDPNFMRTVVLLCDHQEEGSFGFVLNKLFNHTLDELMNGVGELKLPVFYGGPVQMDTLHFLHQYPDKIPGSYEILDGVCWGGDFDTAIALLQSGEIDKNRIRFFIGYSGWGNGQLSGELTEKSWLMAAANRKLVFHGDAAEIWKASLRLLGEEFERMANYPIDPQLN
ncbi:MAG: YqgE/AlgH family protein [Chitinophagaceae bacterium]|nr:MAG: YqgE/AlgH family protein [Chitinophagaceae bacterium]